MRCLMISDVYFPRVNGVSTSIETFRRELRALGHDVTLIAPDYGGVDAGDADIHRIRSRHLVVDPEDRMMRRRDIIELIPQLKTRGYDIVHIQTPFVAHYLGLRLARSLGVPAVTTYHTFFQEYLYHYVPFLPRAWMRAAARHFSRRQCNQLDTIIAPSTAMADALCDYGVTRPIEIIPTGLDLDRFRPGDRARFRARHGIAPDRPVLLHIGRVAFEKNIDFLLRMLARLRQAVPDVLLIIAGEGPAQAHLRRLSLQLGLADHVMFIGYLSRDGGLLDCYSAADAFVFASRTETQGLVLLEAMAMGLPVVSTAHMGTRDILGPGRGALVARDDIADFTAQVERLLADAGLRAGIAAAGRDYVRDWSARAQAERLLAVYERVTAACDSAALTAV